MRKKLISVLLAVCMVLALLPGSALAATALPTSGSCGDNATWHYDVDTKTITIRGSGEVEYIEGFPFQYNEQINNIEFSGDFSAIAGLFLSTPTNITSVEIPDGVTSISSAFTNCPLLNHVIIPSSVTEMYNSFTNSPLLVSAGPLGSRCNLEFGWTEKIPANAFSGNSSLIEFIIPNTIRFIEMGAFSGTSLTKISIPASVIRLDNAFDSCYSLTEISVSENNATYSSQNGLLLNKSGSELLLCPRGRNVCLIPSTVTSIQYGALSACRNLTSIEIPNNVINIGPHAFSGCTQLAEVIISEGLANLNYATFSYCSNLENVFLPATLKNIATDTFAHCGNLKTIAFAGTEAQWNAIEKDGNQELDLAKITFNSTSTPIPPTTPSNLTLTKSTGGLGTKVTTQVTGGHWLTVQVSRAGAISITAIQAPGSGGMVSVSFSAPAGSAVQVWETENELTFTDGVPNGVILNKGTIDL